MPLRTLRTLRSCLYYGGSKIAQALSYPDGRDKWASRDQWEAPMAW